MNASVSFSKHCSLTIMSSWVSNPLPSGHLTYYILSPESNYPQFHPCQYRLNFYLPPSERLENCLKVFFYFSRPFSSSLPLNMPHTAKFSGIRALKLMAILQNPFIPGFSMVLAKDTEQFLDQCNVGPWFPTWRALHQWTNMTLGEFKKVLTGSGSSALTLGSLCPQMAQTQRVQGYTVLLALTTPQPLLPLLLHFLLWRHMIMMMTRIHSEMNFMKWRQNHMHVSNKQLW